MVTKEQLSKVVNKCWTSIEYMAFKYSNGVPSLADDLLSAALTSIVHRYHKHHKSMEYITVAWIKQGARWAMLSELQKKARRKEIEAAPFDDTYRDDLRANPNRFATLTQTTQLHPDTTQYPNPEQLCISKQRIRDIHTAIDDLPPHYHDVCRLVLIHDMSYKETAAKLDIPIGTVMSRLSRGRQILCEWLKDYDLTHELLEK